MTVYTLEMKLYETGNVSELVVNWYDIWETLKKRKTLSLTFSQTKNHHCPKFEFEYWIFDQLYLKIWIYLCHTVLKQTLIEYLYSYQKAKNIV